MEAKVVETFELVLDLNRILFSMVAWDSVPHSWGAPALSPQKPLGRTSEEPSDSSTTWTCSGDEALSPACMLCGVDILSPFVR